jgi:long-chain acyl-CoA synthetase
MILNCTSEISTTSVGHLGDLIDLWAKRSPQRVALVEAAGQWTYAELDRAICETREWLYESGVRPGDRVMIVCENCRAVVALLLASAGMDAWPVPVNARLSAREIDEIRGHCGARRVVYTTGASPVATRHAQRHGALIKPQGLLETVGLSPLNEGAEPEPIDPNRTDRVAVLIYTSGTTGHPKGVMLTHRNLLFAASGAAKIRTLSPKDRLYGLLPISHVAGLSAGLLSALLSGAAIYLSQRFDPGAILNALEHDHLTVLLGTPAMYALLVEYANLKGFEAQDFPALRVISSAGAPLQPTLKAAVEKLFGLALQNAYGMTECAPNIAQTRIESPRSDTSVGPVFPGMEIKLVGSDRRRVGEGEVGELWVRGPNVMKGYYRAPDETAAVLDAEGWFNTRDLAQLDDGQLYIVGRSKEMIVRFGFNVYPAEVEAVLNTHPGVARSAVIGRTLKTGGGDEEIVAFVQPLPGSSLTAGEVASHAAGQLSPYKRPSTIVVIPAMPLTPNGKVAKDALAEMVEHQASRVESARLS